MASSAGERNGRGLIGALLTSAVLGLSGGALCAAPAAAEEPSIWDFVADAFTRAERHARTGAPRSVLSETVWPELAAAAAPATTRIAALVASGSEPSSPADPEASKPETAVKKQRPEVELRQPGSSRAPLPTAAPEQEPTQEPEDVSVCGPEAIGTARSVVIDSRTGGHFGRHDRFGDPSFLGPKEVVLTFDDGPRPKTTRAILETLERHCAKATFFVVGKAARWRPDILRETHAAGHTIAAHTHNHPTPFNSLSQRAAIEEIERGFAEVSEALGAPVAPFFRFPGLAYTPAMLDALSARGISAFSVDVISDDTAEGATPAAIVERTMRRLARYENGILLFHDTLHRTARALPTLLARLKAEGYRIVHLESLRAYAPEGAPSAGLMLSNTARKPGGGLDSSVSRAEPDAAARRLSAIY